MSPFGEVVVGVKGGRGGIESRLGFWLVGVAGPGCPTPFGVPGIFLRGQGWGRHPHWTSLTSQGSLSLSGGSGRPSPAAWGICLGQSPSRCSQCLSRLMWPPWCPSGKREGLYPSGTEASLRRSCHHPCGCHAFDGCSSVPALVTVWTKWGETWFLSVCGCEQVFMQIVQFINVPTCNQEFQDTHLHKCNVASAKVIQIGSHYFCLNVLLWAVLRNCMWHAHEGCRQAQSVHGVAT